MHKSSGSALSKARVRIAARLPLSMAASPILSDFEPFRAVGNGEFGLAELDGLSSARYELLLERLRACFKASADDQKFCLGISATPRVRAVFFDLDATVIAEETIVELARAAGKAHEVAGLTEQAMRGELDFEQALRARVAVLRGLPCEVLGEVAARLTLERGILAFSQFARELAVPIFVVSGGFMPIVEAVTRPLQLQAWRANELEVSGGKLTGQLQGAVIDAAAKKAFVLEQCAKFGFAPEDVAAVGDGANDLLMLGAVGTAIGFNPKPVLREAVHACCYDHAFLAPLLFGRGMATTRARLPA